MRHCSKCPTKGACETFGFCRGDMTMAEALAEANRQRGLAREAEKVPAVEPPSVIPMTGDTLFADHEGGSICLRVRGFNWGCIVDTQGRTWPIETVFREAVVREVGGVSMWCDPKEPPPEPDTYKLNSEKTVAVATETRCSKDMASCPRGVKCYLVGEGGVGHLAIYDGDPFWIEWAPVPGRAL